MKKKIVTIDDLARMVAKGFEDTAKKEQFENLDAKVDNLDKELKEIRKQLMGVVYRYEFDELQTRVKDLENLLAVGNKRR